MQMLWVVSRIINWYNEDHKVSQWSLSGNTTKKVMESVSIWKDRLQPFFPSPAWVFPSSDVLES